MNESLKQILMKRDKISQKQANALIMEAQITFHEYLASGDLDLAENICEEFFGLEQDYLIEFF